jgi:N-acetylglucosaminyl-diphospho-decaprenol L-rhamnosyltransferase
MTPDPVCDLSIIIVSWNVRDLLAACLRSLVRDQESGIRSQGSVPASLTPDFCLLTPEIIVVDNASTDGSAAMVAAEFPRVHLVTNAENRGFTGGNNQGLGLAQGRYVFFLNPDTEVVGDALATMIAFMDAHPEVGALGPQLRYGDGSLQSSRRRFPTFATALFESTPLAWHWPDNPWARRYRMAEMPDDLIQPVDWVVGAALMVRRTVLDRIGGFDEGYFMYSEELDWCRRAKEAGWQIVYLPEAQVIHHEGKSSEQVVAARHIRFQTSKIRYFRKFHGPIQAEALRVFILASFAVEWALEAVKWVLGSKRTLRRERMSSYGLLLESGLRFSWPTAKTAEGSQVNSRTGLS